MNNISDYIRAYLQYCRHQKKLSPNTLRAYQIDMAQFIAYLNSQTVDHSPKEIDKKIIQTYVDHLVTHYAPRSCKRKIACLKAFFNHLEFEDIITVSPFRKLRIAIKEPRVLPRTIKKVEMSALLQHVYKSANEANTPCQQFNAIRNIAIYELLLSTGIRVGELCRLQTDSIDFDNGTIQIHGKGDKERTVYLTSDVVRKAMQNYATIRKRLVGISSEYFFVKWNNGKLQEGNVRTHMQKVSNLILHKQITPHMFRHTFATTLLESNVDIRYIQELLGHSSIKTTQIYLHLSNASIRSALKQACLREQFFSI